MYFLHIFYIPPPFLAITNKKKTTHAMAQVVFLLSFTNRKSLVLILPPVLFHQGNR